MTFSSEVVEEEEKSILVRAIECLEAMDFLPLLDDSSIYPRKRGVYIIYAVFPHIVIVVYIGSAKGDSSICTRVIDKHRHLIDIKNYYKTPELLSCIQLFRVKFVVIPTNATSGCVEELLHEHFTPVLKNNSPENGMGQWYNKRRHYETPPQFVATLKAISLIDPSKTAQEISNDSYDDVPALAKYFRRKLF